MSATLVSGKCAYNSKDKRAVPVKLYALSHDNDNDNKKNNNNNNNINNKITIIIIINTTNTYYAFQLMMNIHMYCV